MSGVISLRSFLLFSSCFLSKAYLCDSFFIIIIFYFFKLLSWCSYQWRFVVKDKDGGYHGSRWQFAVTCPRHHDHHLVWGETEFEQKKKKIFFCRESFVRNKNATSELYFHGRKICKFIYKFRKFPPICMGSINTVILYILTLYRAVTIFADLRWILRFRKPLSTSIFVCMHVL